MACEVSLRKVAEHRTHLPQSIGVAITKDLKVLNEERFFFLQHRYAIVTQDFIFIVRSKATHRRSDLRCDDDIFVNVRAVRSETMYYPDEVFGNLFVIVKACFSIRTSQFRTDQKPTELPMRTSKGGMFTLRVAVRPSEVGASLYMSEIFDRRISSGSALLSKDPRRHTCTSLGWKTCGVTNFRSNDVCFVSLT